MPRAFLIKKKDATKSGSKGSTSIEKEESPGRDNVAMADHREAPAACAETVGASLETTTQPEPHYNSDVDREVDHSPLSVDDEEDDDVDVENDEPVKSPPLRPSHVDHPLPEADIVPSPSRRLLPDLPSPGNTSLEYTPPHTPDKMTGFTRIDSPKKRRRTHLSVEDILAGKMSKKARGEIREDSKPLKPREQPTLLRPDMASVFHPYFGLDPARFAAAGFRPQYPMQAFEAGLPSPMMHVPGVYPPLAGLPAPRTQHELELYRYMSARQFLRQFTAPYERPLPPRPEALSPAAAPLPSPVHMPGLYRTKLDENNHPGHGAAAGIIHQRHMNHGPNPFMPVCHARESSLSPSSPRKFSPPILEAAMKGSPRRAEVGATSLKDGCEIKDHGAGRGGDGPWPFCVSAEVGAGRTDSLHLSPTSDSDKSPSDAENLPLDLVSRSEEKKIRPTPPRFQCDGCKKSYSTFNGLSKHKEFHCTSHVKKEFSCQYCDKTYTSLGALKMHIRTHTLPCKCQICGKAFSRPWLLQGHIRTHTGEKPFICPHCGRSFADRSNLRAHLQTHSDVKKYSCKTCAKTFSRMSLLLKHQDNSCMGVIH